VRVARPRAVSGLLIAFAWASVALAAHAQSETTDVGAAARAFQRGQRAQLRHEYSRAAALFELADEAAPSPAALRSAIRNWDAAGNAARAATLARLAVERYPHDVATMRLAAGVLTQRARSLGSLRAHCAPACALVVDGRSTTPTRSIDHEIYLAPGEHAIVAEYGDGRATRQRLHLGGGEQRELTLQPPADPAHPRPATETPPPAATAAPVGDDNDLPSIDDAAWTTENSASARAPATPPGRAPAALPARALPPPAMVERSGAAAKRDRRLPPIAPVLGVGLTLGLGAVLVWSFTDTISARDRYVEHPTADGYHDGVARESRTYGLLGGVAGLGVATLAVALFATNWHAGFTGGGHSPRTALRLSPQLAQTGSAWFAGVAVSLD
jgi:hypothetical protein